MENLMKFIISLCFVSLLISCVLGAKIDFDITIHENITTDTTGNDFYFESLEITKQILVDKIEYELSTNGIELEFLQINADILDNDSIIIDSVNYMCRENEDESIIKNTIINMTGCQKVERINK